MRNPRLILPTLATAVFAIDAEQRIQLWTEGMEHLLGVPTAQALGRPCYQVVKARSLNEAGPCQLGCRPFRSLQEGHLEARWRIALGPGPEAPQCVVEELALPPGAGPRVLVFFHPEGEPTSLSSLVQDVSALGHVAGVLSQADLDGALRSALTIALETAGAEAAEAFLREPTGQQMVMAGHQGLFRDAFQQITSFRQGEGFPGLVAASGSPVFTQDLANDPRYLRTRVKEQGFQQYLCVPIPGASGVVGCLNLASRAPDATLADRLPLLSAMAAPLGSAIQSWHAQAQEQVTGLTPQVALTLEGNLQHLVSSILRRLRDIGGARAGSAVVYDPVTHVPCLRVAEGEELGGLNPPSSCLALREARPLQVAFCSDFDCPMRRHGAGLCLPLVADGRALGMVWLRFNEPDPMPGARFSLVSATAQRAATLLNHVLAYRQLHQAALQAERERLGQAVSEAVGPVVTTAGPPVLAIRCLGPFQVSRDGQAIPLASFSRRQAVAALKVLAAQRGKPVASEVLVEQLWPEAEPESARNRLYGVIHALRLAIESAPRPPWRVIRTQGDSYYLEPSACRVDVDDFLDGFRRGMERERQGQPEAALEAYHAAAQRYSGDFLEDEPYAEWCWGERERLRETYLDLLRRMAALHEPRGELEESILCLRQALRVDPLREDLHRELMACLARAGRRGEALRQYQRCRRLLRQELAVSPLPQTQHLYHQIRAHTAPIP